MQRLATMALFVVLVAACSDPPATEPAASSGAQSQEQASADPQWHATATTATYTDPQIGVFRIECDGAGVAISGPSGVSQTSQPETVVVLSSGGTALDHDALLDLGAGGPRFVVRLPADDPAITGLATGQDLMVIHGLAKWTVPGAGAPPVLGPLLAACAT